MTPTLSLVPATAAAVTPRGPALNHVRGALVSPIILTIAVIGTLLGISVAGLLGALAALVMVTIGGVLSARSPRVRAYLERRERARVRGEREASRLRQLRPTGALRQAQYLELRELVETLERDCPGDARRFELQELLEHFIHLSVAHQRCVDALRLAGSPESIAPARGKRRIAIQARRARHRDACLARIEHLCDELEGTDELVRLIAQRAACPSLESELDREIDRRLWELDEVDEAMNQLSA